MPVGLSFEVDFNQISFSRMFQNILCVGLCLSVLTACARSPNSSLNSAATVTGQHPEILEIERTVDEPQLSAQSGLEDYLRYAALNNPGLEAAFNRWKMALERIPQVRALPDPRFNYGYFVEQVETRVGPQRQKFGIAQTFPWFGKLRLRGNKAGEAAVSAQKSYEMAKLKLFRDVKDAYYELAYLQRAIRLTEENIELVRHLESVAQAKFRAGSDVTAVVKAQVELGKLGDKVSSLRELRDPINARLNAALNRDLQLPLPWPKSMPRGSVTLDDAVVAQALIRMNPELAGLDAKIRESEHSIKLARKAFYPDLTLGVDYVETEDARFAGVSGSGKDPVMIMGSFNLPLWWGKNQAGLREAKASLGAATKERENRENLLVADLQMALYRFHDAERKISLFGDTLSPLARNSLDVAEQAYQAGRADFLQLIDAQRLLLDIQLSYQRAIADREQQLAQIEMISGGSVLGERLPSDED